MQICSFEHNPFSSRPFEFPPGHRVQFVRELNKSKVKLNPVSSCVAKKRLNPHKHSTISTSKRMKVTSVDDEVDDTDIDGTEVFTGVQVAKQVRSSMKKWIKKQDDVFWHNYVKMNIIHCVLNLMKEVQGHFQYQ